MSIKDLISKNYKDIIKPVAVLLGICVVIPLALGITNKVTKSRISELEVKNTEDTMNQLIKADSFESEKYKSGDTEFTYYIAEKSGKTAGYIFITEEKGYGGGTVSVMTAVNTDGTVKNIGILDVTSQTPGLGQNAAKQSFYSQYAGKKSGVEVKKSGADSENNEVNAITGATVTSKAVTNAVNTALSYFNSVDGKTENSATEKTYKSTESEVTGYEQ